MEKRGRKSLQAVVCVVAVLFTLAGALQAWGESGGARFVADELLVQPKAGAATVKIDEVLTGLGATVDEEIPQIGVRKIKVPPQALEKVKAALSRNPHVEFVEPNYLATSSGTPNDPSYPSQWHLPKISAPLGWDIVTGSNVVDIAIIDSGVDPAHPDLAGKLLPGYNFLVNNSDTHDVLGHGTAVAGAAGALSNNSIGVAGVAWQNPLMPLVVLDANDYASYSNIARAITYAVDQGVRVINISIGGSSSSLTLQNAVNYAWSKGAVIFASAMNNSTSALYYPAACNSVVAVSATTSSDTIASFSNYGSWITVSAPGSGIYTTNRGGGYGAWNGTSFSSPITAGLAALILSVNPMLTNAQVVDIIKQNADDLGTAGFDQYFGYGRINVYKSLTAARNAVPQSDTTAPTASITSPGSGATLSGAIQVNVSALDDVGVAKVVLYINGASFAGDTVAPYSFYWDTTGLADGTYDLYAVAYDAAGNAGQSNHSLVSVINASGTSPPQVSITSPANGSTVGNKTTVTAAAYDNIGVSRMELYIDNSLKTTAGSGSLSLNWNSRNAAPGAHVIKIKAFDAAGNVGMASLTVYK
ncbi:MAG: peptidase S8/S53 subtilisin kexin [Geobacteraceae bacterium]|nr:MAG: peptidase S8/S53 subtilisin kexin [Geobacteraceae bacterium]